MVLTKKSIFEFTLLLLTSLAILSGCLSSGDEGVTTRVAGETPNNPPIVSGNPSPAVQIGDSYLFQPTATDPDGDSLAFEVRNLPSWAAFDAKSGRLSGVPLLGNEGVYGDIEIIANDGNASGSLVFSITVTAGGVAAVTLSWTPPTNNVDGSVLTDLAAYKLYYGNTSGDYTNSIYISNPSISTYTVENLTPDTYFFAATSINSLNVESAFSNEAVKVAN